MSIKEACVDTVERAQKAELLGADRVELCARLDVDGLTPSSKLILQVCNSVKIPVMVMVRHREGNFHYTDEEHAEILKTVQLLTEFPIHGVVFGSLTDEGWPNIDQVNDLVQMAGRLETTFHKAIDESPDPAKAAKLLSSTGITRILTSGGKETAEEGASIINQMQLNSSASIVAAGRITFKNFEHVKSLLNVTEFHGKRIVGDLYSV